MPDSVLIDEAIRVVVSPSQASYFAGEPFSVSITITNLRTPHTSVTPRSVSHSAYLHKRGAHSVSYVPMARPPTSPGVRTAVPASSVRQFDERDSPVRRGIVGRGQPPQGADVLPETSESTKKRPLATKSLSVSITTHDLREDTLQDPKGKSPARTLRTQAATHSSPTSPYVPSPLARSATVPVNHPHARKHSVLLDGDVQVQDISSPSSLPTPNPSTSAFSLSLDPISESTSSPVSPATPMLPSPLPNGSLPDFRPQHLSSSASAGSSLSAGNVSAQSLRAEPAPRKPPLLGLGNGHSTKGPARKIFSSSFSIPNSELILYSYAQLVGTLALVPLPTPTPTFEQARTLHAVRDALTRTKGVGGGSMDIASHTPQSLPYGQQTKTTSRRPSHSRSSSLSVGLLSLLSPTSRVSPPPSSPATQSSWTPSHRARSPSVLSALFGSSASTSSSSLTGLGIASSTSAELDPIDPETPLPTFEVQPKMLAVDLTLAPGESRCYTYQLDLPRNLPPSYRGRCLRFSYEFVLGVCRAVPPTASGASSSSRVLKVPIRVYNHVVIDRPPTPYDLLWPVHSHGRPIKVSLIEHKGNTVPIATGGPSTTSIANHVTSTCNDLRLYARSLLASAKATGNITNDRGADGRTNGWSDPSREETLSWRGETEREPSCREAVEILTRNPKKLSYDVNKDGVKVAVLTFTKSAYRLGETVMGVVELNRRASRTRVLKLSALLEAHESLPGNIAPPEPSTSHQLRRVHAEHHSSFVADTLRTTFSLDIPPDASPAFQIDVSSPLSPLPTKGRPGGLEWKVRLCLFVAVASSNAREGVDGVKLKHLTRVGQPGAWGSSWKAAKTIAPSERSSPPADAVDSASSTLVTQSWTSFLTSALLGSSEPGMQYHDGDEEVDGSDIDDLEADIGTEEDWREVQVEMVECEVPIKVWPGNTAFKASEVVLDV